MAAGSLSHRFMIEEYFALCDDPALIAASSLSRSRVQMNFNEEVSLASVAIPETLKQTVLTLNAKFVTVQLHDKIGQAVYFVILTDNYYHLLKYFKQEVPVDDGEMFAVPLVYANRAVSYYIIYLQHLNYIVVFSFNTEVV